MALKSAGRRAERRLFYTSAVLIMSSLFLMGTVSKTIQRADDDQLTSFVGMFGEVYKNIKDRYVEDVDSKKLFEGAIQGMFMTLDPHSQYMEPDNYMQLEKDTEGNFSGVGIQITMRDGVLTVMAPMPGSPAAKAGVKPWDRIIEIDGKKTEGITLIDAVKKLTGPTGTSVKIKVYREGESDFLEFELVRRNIKVESVITQMMEDGIAYARVTKFSDNTTRDLRKALEQFREKGAKGLIVDLRFNTGGLLNEAVEMSSLFLGRDKVVVSTKGRVRSQNKEYKAEGEAVTDLPLLVLINRSSASASEIFAGAIKDHNRGVVVGIKGQRSFGKGSVQTIEELNQSFEKDDNGNPRRAAIRLTTAKYYLPKGETIDKVGVTPDIAVELPKGAQEDLIRHGMIGDPNPEEDDEGTTKTRFNWKNFKGEKGAGAGADKSTTSAAVKEVGSKTSVVLDKDGNPTGVKTEKESEDQNETDKTDEDSIMGSALSDKDKDSSGTQPKRVIPIDKSLFPEAAEEEAAAKKVAEQKKKANKKFVDYQLEVAKRLLREKLENGKDFFDPTSAMPTEVKNIAEAAEKAPGDRAEARPAATDPKAAAGAASAAR